MAKSNTKRSSDVSTQSNPSVEFELREELRETKELLDEAREQISRALDLLSERDTMLDQAYDQINGIPQKTSEPKNYDNFDHDEFLNKQVDGDILSKGIVSRVYRGRFVAFTLSGEPEERSILLSQHSHHKIMTQTEEHPYVPIRHSLSVETFFLIYEGMRFAIEKFGLDRESAIAKLTGGGEIVFKEAISSY